MKRISTIIILGLCVLSCAPRGESVTGVSFDEVVATRRSVRSYDASKSVSEAQVREILAATQEAASWANTQTSRYYVAIGPQKRAALLEMVGGNKERVKDAPVLIVSTFVTGRSGFFNGQATNEIGNGWGAYDNGLSNAYFILKARAMGMDTLIMGMRDSEAIRKEFQIPADETVMAVIALGYRAAEPNRPGRIPLDEMAKFF